MVDDYNDPAATLGQDAGASEADTFQAELRKIREENGLEAPQGAPTAPPVGVSPLAQELDQSGFFAQQEAAHASQMERELQEAIRRSQASAPPEPPSGTASRRGSGSDVVAPPPQPKGSPGNPYSPQEAFDLPPADFRPGTHYRDTNNRLFSIGPNGVPVPVETAAPAPSAPVGGPGGFPGFLIQPETLTGPQGPTRMPGMWAPGAGDIYEAGRFTGVAASQVPGGAISGVGSVLQAPDVVVSGVEHAGQTSRLWLRGAMDAIDRGEPVAFTSLPPRTGGGQGDPQEDDRRRMVVARYQRATPEQRALLRTELQSEIDAFSPTPIQSRPLYRAGETVQEYGRTFSENVLGIPLPEGYTEQSFAVQLGRGLGSMITGLPATWIGGPAGGALVFGPMGMGEATQRAVRFDQAERAAGRPGLTQEQIISAGLLGVGPGTTDILPVETLLGRLPLPIPPALRTALARSIARVGGQAIVEGVQEGGQQFLQNVIAWHIYNPNQVLTEEIIPNLLVGSAVGAVAQGAGEVGRGALGLARRGGRTGTPSAPPTPEAVPAPAPAPAPVPGTPSADQAAPQAAPDAFGFDLPPPPSAAPEAVPPTPEAATAAPQAEAPTVAPEAGTPPAVAGAAPESVAQVPAPQDAEAQLLQTVERILQERPDAVSPEETEVLRRMAERFAPAPEAQAEAQRQQAAEQAEIERVVAENLPQWRGEIETALQGRGINIALADQDARVIAARMARSGVSATEAIEQHAWEAYETERQARAAGEVARQAVTAAGRAGQAAAAPTPGGATAAPTGASAGATAGAAASGTGAGTAAAGATPAAAPAATVPGEPGAARTGGARAAGVGGERAGPAAAPETRTAGSDERGVRDGERATGGAASVEAPPAGRRYTGPPLSDAEIDVIADNWKYVREFFARPRPVSLANFIVRSGGIEDRGGDVKSLAGSIRSRPGLVRRASDQSAQLTGIGAQEGSGLSLDDWALRAWEVGYFPFNTERPTINEFLDKLQDDLRTGTEVPAGEETYFEDAAIAAEMEAELADYGITTRDFRKEETLRAYLGQPRAAAPRQAEGVEGAQAADVRGEPAAEPAQPVTDPTPAQRSQLRGVLASRQALDWATVQAQIGATDEQLEAMRKDAAAEGLLRLDRNGAYKRTPQGVTSQAGPELSVTPEERVEGAIRAREAQTGTQVSPTVRAYGVELLSRLGFPSFMATLERAKADKGLSADDVRDLAAIAGTEVAKRAKKATAFASIEKRHQDHRAFLEKQAVESAINVELAAFSDWNPLLLIRDRLWNLYVGWRFPKDRSIMPVGAADLAREIGVQSAGGLSAEAVGLNARLREATKLQEDILGLVFDHREAARVFRRERNWDYSRPSTIVDAIFNYYGGPVDSSLAQLAIQLDRANLAREGIERQIRAEVESARRGGRLEPPTAASIDELLDTQAPRTEAVATANDNLQARIDAQLEAMTQERQRPDLRVIEGGLSDDGDGPPILLASFASATASGQSQRAELDALGFYSKALEAAKAWKQPRGTPEQVLQHLLKAGSGVKNEIEALGLTTFLEGKKSVTRDEIVSYLRENRVEVREATYGGPTAADAETASLLMDEDIAGMGLALPARWRSHSLARDDNNPSYRETVLHLPADNVQSRDEYIAERRQFYPNDTDAQHEAAYNQFVTGRSVRGMAGTAFRSGHFPEPNVIGNLMTSLNKLGDKTTFAISQIQSDWSQAIRDRTRDAVAKSLFDPNKPDVKARIAEIDKQREEALKGRETFLLGEPLAFVLQQGDAIPPIPANTDANVASSLRWIASEYNANFVSPENQSIADAFLADPRNTAPSDISEAMAVLLSPDKRFKELPDNLKSEVSAAISQARQRGELPAGARDETKIARLKQRIAEEEVKLARYDAGEATAAEQADYIPDVNSIGESPRDVLVSEINLLKAELAGAEASVVPSHPFVNTTDQWLTTTLRHVVRQAIAAGADSISIPSGATVLDYNPQGSEEGNEEFYDKIVPINLAKVLKGIDASIKPQRVATVQSPVDGRELGKGFTVFPITDKVREQVQREGLALFALSSQRSRLGPEERQNTPPYTDAFASRIPEVVSSIEGWVRKMLPPEIAVRVVDRIDMGGYGIYARYTFLESPTRLMDRAVEVALTTQLGVTPLRTTVVKAFHEVTHALREYGRPAGGIYGSLLTDKEWQIVVERAKKIGIEKNITALQDGKPIPAIPVYRRFYREQLAAAGFRGEALDQRVEELIDQELVANLAEQWATGTSFGARIDSWLERIIKFVEAVRNALNGLGFQTYDDVFRSMASGEVARRPEGGRREPTLEIPKYDPNTYFPRAPSPAAAHLASEEGQEALGIFLPAFSTRDLLQRVQASRLFQSVSGVASAVAGEAQNFIYDNPAILAKQVGATVASHYAGPVAKAISDRIWALYSGWKYPNERSILPARVAGERGIRRSINEASSRRLGEADRDLTEVKKIQREIETLAQRYFPLGPFTPQGLRDRAQDMDQSRPYAMQVARLAKDLERMLYFRELLENVIAEERNTGRRGGIGEPANQNRSSPIPALQAQFDAEFEAMTLERERPDLQVIEGGPTTLAAFSSQPPARTGKHGSLPEEAAFRKLMGRQYEIAKASGDLSTQYDILGGRLNNDRSMPPAMREAMELERVRIAREMGPDARQAAGIPDPDVVDDESGTSLAAIASTPETRPFPGFEGGTATEKVKETGERLRTYAVGDSSLIVSEQPDGSWELTFFRAEDASTIPAIVAAIEANDLGKPISPRGWLTPQGYQYWLQVAPDRVKFHVNAGDLFGGMYASPRAVEFAEAVLDDGRARQIAQEMTVLEQRLEALDPSVTASVQRLGLAWKRHFDIHSNFGFGGYAGFFKKIAAFSSAMMVAAGYTAVTVADSGSLASAIPGLGVMGGIGYMATKQLAEHVTDIRNINRHLLRVNANERAQIERSINRLRGLSEVGAAAGASDDARLTEASSHLSRLKSSLPQEAFTEARREERFSLESAPPLDMSPEARKARAEEMGFDTSRVWYHGTASQFDQFVGYAPTHPSEEKYRGAIFLTNDQGAARDYAMTRGNTYSWRGNLKMGPNSRVLSLYIKAGPIANSIGEYDPAIHVAASISHTFGRELVVFDPARIRSTEAAFDPSQEGSPVLLASFVGGPGAPPSGGPQLPTTPASQGDIRGLSDIIADLKSALRMTTTQGLYGMRVRDRAGGRSWSFRPQSSVRSQYDANAGVARIRVATDIDAIAREGGRHIEQVFGAPMQAFLQTHAEELAVQPAPDNPLPAIAPTGFSGIELDADTQRALVDAASYTRQWQALTTAGAPQATRYDVAAQAAIARSTLQRRLGRTIADHLVTDLVSQTAQPAADYVRERYSATGTPAPRVAPTPSAADISTGFASFFQRYITDPDSVKRDMPGVYVGFEQFLDANDPAMLEGIERVQLTTLSEDYKAYREATALERLKADTVSHADQRMVTRLKEWFRRNRRGTVTGTVGAMGSEVIDGVESLSSVVYEGAVDETHPFYLVTRKLLEQADTNRVIDPQGRAISLAVHENPAKLIRSVGDAFKTGLRWIQDGMPNYRHGGAGFEVVAPGGRTLGIRPDMASAQALAATSTEKTTIVPLIGRRSPPLRDALQLAMGNNWNYQAYENLGAYLIARRAIEEWARYQRGELERRPIKSYATGQPADEIAALTAIIREFEQANPNFSTAAQVVYDFLWQQAIHDFQSGRYNQAKLDYLATRKHFYVPFSRDMTDLLAQRGFGGRTITFSKDKRFEGSDRSILNPIEAIIDQTFHRAAATHMNEVVGAVGRLIDRVGSGAGAIGERVTKTEIIEANSNGFSQLQAYIEGLGYDAHDASEMVHRVAADFGDTHLLVTQDPTNLGPKRPILLTLYENGERQYVRINDPEWAQHIYSSVNGIGRELTSLFIDSVAAPAALLRFGVTTSPAFVLPNIIRDMWSSWILTGGVNPRTWPIVTQVRGLYHELTQSDMAELYQEVAGTMGGQNVAALSKVRDKADVMALKDKGLQMKPVRLTIGTAVGAGIGFTLGGPGGALMGAFAGAGLHRGIGKGRFIETMSYFSDMSETATRMGVFTEAYRAALAYNPDLTPYQAAQEAAFVARDLIDFGRRGSKMLAAARLVPFMNAAIQGLDKAQRTLLARSDRGNAFSTTKLIGHMAAGAGAGFMIAGPVGGAVGTFAGPALASNLAARSAAARALLSPFTRKDMGIRMSRDEERAMGQSAKSWANLLVYTLTLVAAGSLWHWLTDDDDEYNRIPPRFRFRNQPMKINGQWFMFPKAFEWAIPSNIIEAAIESQFARDPRFWERVREGLFDNLAPPGVPQAVRIWGDVRSNYDSFRQRPIVADYIRTDAPELQFNAYASQFAIALSRAVNSRPWARSTVETAGSTIFGTNFELTPAIIDYVLRTGGGYWGADIQRFSNVTTVGGSRITDFPIIGAIGRRFTFDPNRVSDAMTRYWELLGREHFGFRRAAQSYQRYNEMYGPHAANQHLATLEDPEQQAYALLEASGSRIDRQRHPLTRVQRIVRATMDMERDLTLERLADTSVTSSPTPIRLSPAKRDEVRDALARIRAIEAHNAMVTLQHRQFAGRQILDMQPALDILAAASPEAFREYELRLQRARVVAFSEVQGWPAERDRLLQEWREAMDQEAALIRPGGRGRRPVRLPLGTSRELEAQP